MVKDKFIDPDFITTNNKIKYFYYTIKNEAIKNIKIDDINYYEYLFSYLYELKSVLIASQETPKPEINNDYSFIDLFDGDTNIKKKLYKLATIIDYTADINHPLLDEYKTQTTDINDINLFINIYYLKILLASNKKSDIFNHLTTIINLINKKFDITLKHYLIGNFDLNRLFINDEIISSSNDSLLKKDVTHLIYYNLLTYITHIISKDPNAVNIKLEEKVDIKKIYIQLIESITYANLYWNRLIFIYKHHFEKLLILDGDSDGIKKNRLDLWLETIKNDTNEHSKNIYKYLLEIKQKINLENDMKTLKSYINSLSSLGIQLIQLLNEKISYKNITRTDGQYEDIYPFVSIPDIDKYDITSGLYNKKINDYFNLINQSNIREKFLANIFIFKLSDFNCYTLPYIDKNIFKIKKEIVENIIENKEINIQSKPKIFDIITKYASEFTPSDSSKYNYLTNILVNPSLLNILRNKLYNEKSINFNIKIDYTITKDDDDNDIAKKIIINNAIEYYLILKFQQCISMQVNKLIDEKYLLESQVGGAILPSINLSIIYNKYLNAIIESKFGKSLTKLLVNYMRPYYGYYILNTKYLHSEDFYNSSFEPNNTKSRELYFNTNYYDDDNLSILNCYNQKNLDIIDKLIIKKVNLNEADYKKWTPIYYAIDSRNIENINKLLNIGSDNYKFIHIDLRLLDNFKISPVQFAVNKELEHLSFNIELEELTIDKFIDKFIDRYHSMLFEELTKSDNVKYNIPLHLEIIFNIMLNIQNIYWHFKYTTKYKITNNDTKEFIKIKINKFNNIFKKLGINETIDDNETIDNIKDILSKLKKSTNSTLFKYIDFDYEIDILDKLKLVSEPIIDVFNNETDQIRFYIDDYTDIYLDPDFIYEFIIKSNLNQKFYTFQQNDVLENSKKGIQIINDKNKKDIKLNNVFAIKQNPNLLNKQIEDNNIENEDNIIDFNFIDDKYDDIIIKYFRNLSRENKFKYGKYGTFWKEKRVPNDILYHLQILEDEINLLKNYKEEHENNRVKKFNISSDDNASKQFKELNSKLESILVFINCRFNQSKYIENNIYYNFLVQLYIHVLAKIIGNNFYTTIEKLVLAEIPNIIRDVGSIDNEKLKVNLNEIRKYLTSDYKYDSFAYTYVMKTLRLEENEESEIKSPIYKDGETPEVVFSRLREMISQIELVPTNKDSNINIITNYDRNIYPCYKDIYAISFKYMHRFMTNYHKFIINQYRGYKILDTLFDYVK